MDMNRFMLVVREHLINSYEGPEFSVYYSSLKSFVFPSSMQYMVVFKTECVAIT
jgi:hypothetical protein